MSDAGSSEDATILDAAMDADGAGDAIGSGAIDAAEAGPDGSIDAADAGNAADAGPIPTSCQTSGGGITNCGGNDAGDNCCASLEVAGNNIDGGATFYRAYTAGEDGGTYPATVSGFRLDKYLITVGRFRQYVNYVTSDGGAPPAANSGKHAHLNGGNGLSVTAGGYETGWDSSWDSYIATGPSAAATWTANLATNCVSTCADSSTCPSIWTSLPNGNENMPINCINWYEAYAFCIWDGGFLPSEAEWEYAAAGGSQQREYPWGSTDPGTGNQYAIYGCDYPSGSGTCNGAPYSLTSIAAVGSAPLGVARWGQLDMAGEFWQWDLGSYETPYADPCVDCVEVPTTINGSTRGGSYFQGVALILPTFVGGYPLAGHVQNNGGRCARVP